MSKTSKELRASLKAHGFSQSAIRAAWPEWWTDAADASQSARTELQFSLARKLGLDPRSLVRDEDEPTFVWSDRTKYKRLKAETDFEQGAIASFGTNVARALLSATRDDRREIPAAPVLREAILRRSQFVGLPDILGVCAAFGIPVGYLRVFPLSAKRMSAMSVQAEGKHAILLGQEATYPAPVAFYIAHELGHIALGHLADQSALVDVGDPLRQTEADDEEEKAADRWALELLTGSPEPHIGTRAKSFIARQLAEVALASAPELRIEPGTIALCFGYDTGRWNKAYAALRHIYRKSPVWSDVNRLLERQVQWEQLTDEMAQFLRLIFEIPDHAQRRA